MKWCQLENTDTSSVNSAICESHGAPKHVRQDLSRSTSVLPHLGQIPTAWTELRYTKSWRHVTTRLDCFAVILHVVQMKENAKK